MHRSVERQRCGGSRMVRSFPKERTPLNSTLALIRLYTSGGVQKAHWVGLNWTAELMPCVKGCWVPFNRFCGVEPVCGENVFRFGGARCPVQHSDARLRSGLSAGG
jgi:hypothetical protein